MTMSEKKKEIMLNFSTLCSCIKKSHMNDGCCHYGIALSHIQIHIHQYATLITHLVIMHCTALWLHHLWVWLES